jgi:hypothetical protein
MKNIYGWRKGWTFSADPQEVGELIEELKSPTAEEFVNAARDKNSPAHNLFEWNTELAAKQNWLQTAQNIMRNIIITVIIEDQEQQTRAFECVTVKSDETKRYVPIKKALGKKEWRDEVYARITHALESAEQQLEIYNYMQDEKIEQAKKHVKRAIEQLVVA